MSSKQVDQAKAALASWDREIEDVPFRNMSLGWNTMRSVLRNTMEALEDQRQVLDRYRTAFDWEGMRSWAEATRNRLSDYDAHEDDGFAYPALKMADKILAGIAALEDERERNELVQGILQDLRWALEVPEEALDHCEAALDKMTALEEMDA